MINFILTELLLPPHFQYPQTQVFDGKVHQHQFIKAIIFLPLIIFFHIPLFPLLSFSLLL
jgi:hypothetical protein